MVVTVDAQENIVGNNYNKYSTRNALARFLVQRFLKTVGVLARAAAPNKILEVGCGEGYLSAFLAEKLPSSVDIEACDLSLEKIPADINPRIKLREASAYSLPWPDREFDLVVCCEVLEHLTDPLIALKELSRVTNGYVLLSVPREPLWRLLNVFSGRYLRRWGNTPGHVQHFSLKRFSRLVSTVFVIDEIRLTLPWIVVLAHLPRGPEA